MISIKQILFELVHTQELADKGRTEQVQGLTLRQQMQFLTTNMIASGLCLEEGKKAFEKEWIVIVLLANRGNQCKAAADLNMHRNTLSREIERLGIDMRIIRGVKFQNRVQNRKPIQPAAMAAAAGAKQA